MKVTGTDDEFDYHVGSMSALGDPGAPAHGGPEPDKAGADWLKTAVNEVLLQDVPTVKTPLAVDYYYWHQAAVAWTLLGDARLQ